MSNNYRLVVRRDNTTEGAGRWRLAWNMPNATTFTHDESSVTGRPYFRTMREAIAHGMRKYGERAVKVNY